MKFEIFKVVALMFAGGLLTSLAEYKFKYNLYDSIKDLINRIRGKQATTAAK